VEGYLLQIVVEIWEATDLINPLPLPQSEFGAGTKPLAVAFEAPGIMTQS
jgi:hypothetical protein